MDKLNYFLFLKKKYINILSNLKEIHNECQELLTFENLSDIFDVDFILQNNYIKQIHDLESYITQLDIKICDNCNHNFIYDEIDITPDKTIRIKYCTTCEYTL